ncbi:MAG: cytochrome-c peroxidase [Gammaproteobacteria bacterium]|nr:cytochrome-c peroxidase [Gammaproteobacteria bacterium]MDH5734669.1 cytochrome-c peroxidase [Gammaproteobacteria bacterium]
MQSALLFVLLNMALLSSAINALPLGLPPVPIPNNNPQTDLKINLGDKLYHDARFSADGKVSCATCHAREKGFTDNLPVSKGFNNLTGTRNAPTVINSAYYTSLFWDGREPDLEGQSKQPPINPVEGGLKNHKPILKVIREDNDYVKAFKDVFNVKANDITMDHVAMAIASFERTIIAGDSAFDKYMYANDKTALNDAQQRGLAIYLGKGRCVSCHVIEQTQALFTDNRFHNIGIGFKKIKDRESETAAQMLAAKRKGANVDETVLTQANMSELGRFAVTENPTQVGAFKTPTLRNIAVTAPYMHDGSLKTLEEVVDFYNNGGRLKDTDPVSGFLSGGIRPLKLSEQEKKDLVAFMKALTSPEYQALANKF